MGAEPHLHVALGQVEGLCLGADAVVAAGVLFDAGHVDLAVGLSVAVEVELECNLEVGVEHEVGLVVVANGLPLPVREVVRVSGVLCYFEIRRSSS